MWVLYGVDVIGSKPITFELSAEQRSTLGTSFWLTDPLDPTKNVGRPSFAFRQIQAVFAQHLSTMEREYFRSLSTIRYNNNYNNNDGSNNSNSNSNSKSQQLSARGRLNNGNNNNYNNKLDEVDLLRSLMKF
jgi:hypothetical protein